MDATEIREGEHVLARYIPESKAWGNGLKFFSSDADFQQVGTWRYDQKKELLAHSHNKISREVLWTQEVLYVRSGKVRASFFGISDKKVAELDVCAGDILILLCGGHGYEILEDGTEVLEIKNGPYVGADADRRRL